MVLPPCTQSIPLTVCCCLLALRITKHSSHAAGAARRLGATHAATLALSLSSPTCHDGRRPRTRVPVASASSEPDSSSRDVASIVGNLHGGKYQFGAGGADRYTGAAFAESLASSSSSDTDHSDGDGGRPRWAQSFVPAEPVGTLFFGMAGDEQAVSVVNAFRTWEPWYAEIVEGCSSHAFAFISAAQGTLAPRGGANNVCDDSSPYLDSAVLVVRCEVAPARAMLVVKTEEQQWTFSLTSG